MASSITSAGAASGIDLESIISATLAAKRTTFEAKITKKETATQTTLSGLSQLKSALSTFKDTLDALAEDGAFNQKSVTIKQDEDDPVFEVETTDDTSNGAYNITVESLAAGTKYESAADAFTSASQVLATQTSTLTFSAGDESFDVTVKAGDTLANIRDRINKSSSNFGLTVNIVNSSSGSKLVIESEKTGSANALTITASNSELQAFDTTGQYGATAVLSETQSATDAVAYIDGTQVTSDTNTFEDAIQDLSFTALRVSDKDDTDVLQSNKLTISTDQSAIKDQVNKYIASYNVLFGTLTSLGARSTIVGGENQGDGGALEGDSYISAIKNYLFNTMSSESKNATIYSSMFTMGVELDDDGYLSLDSDVFDQVMEDNPDQVSALFGGDTGLAATMSAEIKNYIQTGGTIADREDDLNSTLSDLSQKKTDFETDMELYETNLRAKYAALDTLLAKMNNSASALSSLSTSTSS